MFVVSVKLNKKLLSYFRERRIVQMAKINSYIEGTETKYEVVYPSGYVMASGFKFMTEAIIHCFKKGIIPLL